MKRSHFMSAMLPLVLAPGTIWAGARALFSKGGKGFKIAKGESRIHGRLKTGGRLPSLVDLKVSGSDNGGALAVMEQKVLAKGAGVALHMHPDQDEMFYVLEGTFRFKVGEDLYDLKPGDSIFLPRGIPHAWITTSDTATSHVLVQPAGKLEEFFVTLNQMDHAPAAEEVRALAEKCGMVTVGPPLTL